MPDKFDLTWEKLENLQMLLTNLGYESEAKLVENMTVALIWVTTEHG